MEQTTNEQRIRTKIKVFDERLKNERNNYIFKRLAILILISFILYYFNFIDAIIFLIIVAVMIIYGNYPKLYPEEGLSTYFYKISELLNIDREEKDRKQIESYLKGAYNSLSEIHEEYVELPYSSGLLQRIKQLQSTILRVFTYINGNNEPNDGLSNNLMILSGILLQPEIVANDGFEDIIQRVSPQLPEKETRFYNTFEKLKSIWKGKILFRFIIIEVLCGVLLYYSYTSKTISIYESISLFIISIPSIHLLVSKYIK